jgi:hypothetical protein
MQTRVDERTFWPPPSHVSRHIVTSGAYHFALRSKCLFCTSRVLNLGKTGSPAVTDRFIRALGQGCPRLEELDVNVSPGVSWVAAWMWDLGRYRGA